MQIRFRTDRKNFLDLFNKNQKVKFSREVFEKLIPGGDYEQWLKTVLFPCASLSHYNEREACRCFTNGWNASGTVKFYDTADARLRLCFPERYVKIDLDVIIVSPKDPKDPKDNSSPQARVDLDAATEATGAACSTAALNGGDISKQGVTKQGINEQDFTGQGIDEQGINALQQGINALQSTLDVIRANIARSKIKVGWC
jgi:hypothetical protein